MQTKFKIESRSPPIQEGRKTTHLEFVLQQMFLDLALARVEHHQNQIAGPRHIDDLFAATLALGGALDNAGQIQQLNLGVLVFERRRNAGCFPR